MDDAATLAEFDDPVIAIGVLARKTGLSPSALRRYETEGLLIPHRTRAGQRLFSHEDVRRVRNIQRMIRELGLNVEGIRRMQALLPCWELHGCDATIRARCPAYGANASPCWTTPGLDCAQGGQACRQCVVYRFGSLCTEDIKRLIYERGDPRDARGLVEELVKLKGISQQEER
jgi:hypothetical protein